MLVSEFVNEKSKQLVFYLEAYWADNIAFKELDGFIWDVLEEWTNIKNAERQVYSHRERIFWHVLYQVQFVGGHSLRHEDSVRSELQLYTLYLKEDTPCTLDVVGMRP
ncbi:hypothetical protein KJ365_15025 [Glaciecola sp. XM2]|uniref:hypothetical protein n=1 Tax=Glaciecola sp. XM2 TaxID=1914931 RepID=UPI001BDEF344|nr:hypothetical protein [Glaciecola sp. XM2]MBT1452198.1 hypothetical protein [Glaciecola sp. XM2]